MCMNYGFTFTTEQVNLILLGLGELPAKQSLSLIQKIQIDATKQEQLAQAKATEVKAEDEQTEDK